MPDFTLQDAIKEAYASAPAAEVLLHTLEFRHPSFDQPVRVVCNHADLVGTLEASAPENAGEAVTFLAAAFDFRLPEVQKSSTSEIEISVDNVSGDLLAYLDAAAQSPYMIEVTYRPWLASDTSGPQMDPPLTLVVRQISVDIFRITCRAGYGDLANRKFPGETYDAERFPGLVA